MIRNVAGTPVSARLFIGEDLLRAQVQVQAPLELQVNAAQETDGDG